MRTALVTGVSSGIGRAVAESLAQRDFHVICAGRSETRTMPTVAGIADRGGAAEFLHLDLASLRSVKKAASTLASRSAPVDVLVNNAGIGVLIRGLTEDGFEIHFGVNHLGHFLLTETLVPVLAPGARVVAVSSAAHRNAKTLGLDRVQGRAGSLIGWREYGESKLANVLFSRELAKRQPSLQTFAVHPGLVDTGIIPWWSKPLLGRRLLTPAQGADTVVWCATSDEAGAETGRYYRQRQAVAPSSLAMNDDLAAELWERSAAWCSAAN